MHILRQIHKYTKEEQVGRSGSWSQSQVTVTQLGWEGRCENRRNTVMWKQLRSPWEPCGAAPTLLTWHTKTVWIWFPSPFALLHSVPPVPNLQKQQHQLIFPYGKLSCKPDGHNEHKKIFIWCWNHTLCARGCSHILKIPLPGTTVGGLLLLQTHRRFICTLLKA